MLINKVLNHDQDLFGDNSGELTLIFFDYSRGEFIKDLLFIDLSPLLSELDLGMLSKSCVVEGGEANLACIEEEGEASHIPAHLVLFIAVFEGLIWHCWRLKLVKIISSSFSREVQDYFSFLTF